MDTKIVRHGVVSDVDAVGHRVRVTFADTDNVVSAWLPVITPLASKDNIYMLPDVGEEVICISETNDSEQGDGFCVGSMYNDINKTHANDINKKRVDFADGSFIEFDRSTGNLQINCKGDIIIKGKNIYLN